jgi:hypothetical protein
MTSMPTLAILVLPNTSSIPNPAPSVIPERSSFRLLVLKSGGACQEEHD